MPSVSVIIPNYNHGAFLKQRIESILNQTYRDLEIIILDDASTDNSKSIIEEYRNHPQVKQVVYNSVNSGSAFKQWNKGIELACGKYLWIAESDDYCDESFLSTAIDNLNKSGSSLFFCESYLVDDAGVIKGDYADAMDGLWKNDFTMAGDEFIFKQLQHRNAIVNASAVVFEKRQFDLDEIINYKTCGDWLFWVNFLQGDSASLTYCHQKLNCFRSHSTTTRNFDNPNKQVRRIVEECSISYELYKKNSITKKDFYFSFKQRADTTSFHFKMYWSACKELKLPESFFLLFIERKIKLKVIKIKSGIKSILKKTYQKLNPA